MKIIETEAKSLIQKSKIPSIAYVANPYTGCILGCAYCYASFMGRAVGQTVKDWGDYVYVKKNAVELVRDELKRMRPTSAKAPFCSAPLPTPIRAPSAATC